MSSLLTELEPFRKVMDEFIRIYRKVGEIIPFEEEQLRQEDFALGPIHPSLQGAEMELALALREQMREVERLYKEDFVDICEKLIGSRNDEGIEPDYRGARYDDDDDGYDGVITKTLIKMENPEEFTFDHVLRLVPEELEMREEIENDYADKQDMFQMGLKDLRFNLKNFLKGREENDIWSASEEIDVGAVDKAIRAYKTFIAFLEGAGPENAELLNVRIARGVLKRFLQKSKKQKSKKSKKQKAKKQKSKKQKAKKQKSKKQKSKKQKSKSKK